ncbi:MAG: rRNA cytosine-C5-methylase [Actinobacteria bacterium HGW-Actinobacteria-2]|nr:MAG: rRNA cytosine-C5-methylase [Actinobacteria bacterium HGW-Actinobacteria-2]
MSRKGRRQDPARSAAFKILRAVTANGAYANLELARQRGALSSQDAGFATELVSGTCRAMGTYDQILVAASGRELRTLQPAVVDILRLGAHQLLNMRVPAHAAISATVDLAALEVGERLVGLVNAILRKVAARDWLGWLEVLGENEDNLGRIALANYHPRWIAEAFLDLLPLGELIETFEANNAPAKPTLVVRPGLAEVSELGGEPARFSPYGAYADGDPASIAAVAEGRAGVQDEGSQLVALAFSRVEAPAGPWLDLCAGPGGKTAILAGLAAQQGRRLVAAERHAHRAELVSSNLRAFPEAISPTVLTADSTRPPWAPGSFAAVLADVPCTGLGALRRRPESRWRHQPGDVATLNVLQRELLASAINSVPSGGVVAYVTCSPHQAETAAIVAGVADQTDVLSAPEYLPEVPNAALGDFVQLWPHRHGTDAMFLGLLRRR